MYNPITYIKDLIDLVRSPSGEAVAAIEITPNNRQILIDNLEPRALKYLQDGDFYLEFENSSTVCPRSEFFKHYEFIHEPASPIDLTPVRTIKPL